jgi:hypothetical protein
MTCSSDKAAEIAAKHYAEYRIRSNKQQGFTHVRLTIEEAEALRATQPSGDTQELASLVREMLDNLKHCSLESGCCECGSSVKDHNLGSGHSPVDMGHSAAERWIKRAEAALRATHSPSEAEADEAYEIGKRDGYELAVQELDLATGGDGEFKGSTFPGETVDVPVMKARIIERFVALSLPSDKTVELLREGWRAAVAFIECHAADPDITAEMAENYARYREAFKRIDSHLGGAK